MPYSFIWSSFTLRDQNYTMSRWTNGAIEKFIGTKKSKVNSHLNLLPAEYTLKAYQDADGNCIDFMAKNAEKKKTVVAQLKP